MIDLIKSTFADTSTPPRLAVVVSAMGDTTDWLLDAADYAAKGDREVPGSSSPALTWCRRQSCSWIASLTS